MQWPTFMEELKNERVYIFGAGQRGVELCNLLDRQNVCVKGFIDNSISEHGKIIAGRKCYSIDSVIKKEGLNCRIIVSPLKSNGIFEQLEGLSIKNVYDGDQLLKAYYYTPKIVQEGDYENAQPFNHYESPYPDLEEIRKQEGAIFDFNKEILDIDLNEDRQFELMEMMKGLEPMDWTEDRHENYRYYYKNPWFGGGNSNILNRMLRILKPKRVIEVGSGFSTAAMLDTNSKYFQNKMEIISIEPHPERLKALLRETDNITIREQSLQEVELEFFSQLGGDDVLFIDSSHVGKTGSDVNYFFFEIFPRLSRGVYIFMHDIFYPFIYPKLWVYQGRVYNELYMLQAFLMNNKKYSIQFWDDMIIVKYGERIPKGFSMGGGSIWLKKEK